MEAKLLLATKLYRRKVCRKGQAEEEMNELKPL